MGWKIDHNNYVLRREIPAGFFSFGRKIKNILQILKIIVVILSFLY